MDSLEVDLSEDGDFDSQIAGHALSLSLALVTDNLKHFQRVKGLELLAWREE